MGSWNMDIVYCFSSPDGDIVLTAAELQRPFLLASGVPHETLSLGGYFHALEEFVFSSSIRDIADLLSACEQDEMQGAERVKAVFRSEKHGELYHIASVELLWPQGSRKFAISSAISDAGMVCLRKDCNLIKELFLQFGDSGFVPVQYAAREIRVTDGGAVIPVFMTLSEWFDGFHEWHLTSDPESGARGLALWDYTRGNVLLEPDEGKQIIEKATEILVYYFDAHSGSQIYPWHHAAGDFIVKRDAGAIDVRLITVRDYKALVHIPQEQQASSLGQWISFFLHLTLRMRLDKIDGVAETVWLDDYVVVAVISGFLKGYRQKNSGQGGLSETDFLRLLQSFRPEELAAMSHALLEVYDAASTDDARVLCREGDVHWQAVSRELRALSMQ